MVRRGGSAPPSSVRLRRMGAAICKSSTGARCHEMRQKKWRPWMELHHHPPDPKSGALLFELQGNMIRQPELHRSLADTSGVRRYQRFGGI